MHEKRREKWTNGFENFIWFLFDIFFIVFRFDFVVSFVWHENFDGWKFSFSKICKTRKKRPLISIGELLNVLNLVFELKDYLIPMYYDTYISNKSAKMTYGRWRERERERESYANFAIFIIFFLTSFFPFNSTCRCRNDLLPPLFFGVAYLKQSYSLWIRITY